MFAHIGKTGEIYKNIAPKSVSAIREASTQLDEDLDDESISTTKALHKMALAIGSRPCDWRDIVCDLMEANRARVIKTLAVMDMFTVDGLLQLFGAAMILVHQNNLQQTPAETEVINACTMLIEPIVFASNASRPTLASEIKALDLARFEAVKLASIPELNTDFLSRVMDAVRLTGDEFLQLCRDGEGVRLSCAILGIAKFKLVDAVYPENEVASVTVSCGQQQTSTVFAQMKQAAALCKAVAASIDAVCSPQADGEPNAKRARTE